MNVIPPFFFFSFLFFCVHLAIQETTIGYVDMCVTVDFLLKFFFYLPSTLFMKKCVNKNIINILINSRPGLGSAERELGLGQLLKNVVTAFWEASLVRRH